MRVVSTATADLPGTYRFATDAQAYAVAVLARKGGFIASEPAVVRGGYVVTISVKRPDTTRARSTGTHVTLEPGDDLRWMLICEEHGGCCEFHTKREALAHRSEPENWCEDCHEVRYASGWEEDL
jgi:hypothetical protein